MRRLLPILTVLAACMLGLPATAQATPPATAHITAHPVASAPLGGGSDLFTAGGPSGRCSASFAATRDATGFLIASPACRAPVGTLLYSGDQVLVGPVTSAEDGVVLVEVTNTTYWKLVPWVPFGSIGVSIRGSVETPIGGTVCLVSHTTGLTCGSITAKNQTVHFPEGTLTGLTRTTICLDPGGVAFITGDQAQGVTSGGWGNCSTGGQTWFQPVNEILAVYGLSLVTA